jgi:O-methyltransferase
VAEIVAAKDLWVDKLINRAPQKYTENIAKYLARGGILDPESDIQKFAHNDQTRFFAFCLIVDQIAKDSVQGDFAELGVFKGNSAEFLASVARRLGRTTYLLDTFEGFDGRDLSDNESRLQGAFADTSLEAVRAKVGDEQTVFIKGRFPETSSHIPEDASFALVHIDCDLGEPMMAGLRYFYPRTKPGGFIVMHDYNSLYWDGAEQAIDSFFSDKPESIIPLPDLCGSVAIRKSK